MYLFDMKSDERELSKHHQQLQRPHLKPNFPVVRHSPQRVQPASELQCMQSASELHLSLVSATHVSQRALKQIWERHSLSLSHSCPVSNFSHATQVRVVMLQ